MTAPGACSAPPFPVPARHSPVPARHPPAACSAALRLFSASATCSVAIKPSSPPNPGKQSCVRQELTPPPRKAIMHASRPCTVLVQHPVRLLFPITFHAKNVWGRGGAGRLPGPLFFWRSTKKQSTTMASWATQRENIRQAVEAGSRARDTDDGSRVLGLRRGRGAYALLQRADGSVTRAGRPTSACSGGSQSRGPSTQNSRWSGRARPTTCYCRTGSGA